MINHPNFADGDYPMVNPTSQAEDARHALAAPEAHGAAAGDEPGRRYGARLRGAVASLLGLEGMAAPGWAAMRRAKERAKKVPLPDAYV